MACSIIRDKESGKVVQVLAPNGENSYLFENALRAFSGNEELALRAWATVYTNKYKMRYGDWEKGESIVSLDANGEPTIDTVLHTQESVMKTVTTKYADWQKLQPGEDGFVPYSQAVRYKEVLSKRLPGVNIKLVTSHSKDGQAKLVYGTSFKDLTTKYNAKEIKAQKEKVNKVMDYLVAKIPGVKYTWIKPSELKQDEHYFNIGSIRAFVRDNEIFLVEGRVLPEDGIEEVTHIFVESLRQSRPSLFKGLLDAMKEDPKYAAEYILIRDWYKRELSSLKNLENTINSEFLAKQLAKALKAELEVDPTGKPTSLLGKLLQRFLDWLTELFNAGTITPERTLQELAGYINSKDAILPLPEMGYLYYSAEEEADPNANIDPDDRDAIEQNIRDNKKKAIKELNLKKAQKELEKLDKIKKFVLSKHGKVGDPYDSLSPFVGQLKVIDILTNNVKEKIRALELGRDTIGVTKYKGSKKLENIDEVATKLGAGFGTFYHALLEDIQEEYMDTGKSPAIIYLKPEFFDNFYKKNKDLILFENVNKEMLREIGADLVAKLSNLLTENKILLPEISIGVEDIENIMVLGRLDLLSVGTDGTTDIIDLKTKKVGYDFRPGTFPSQMFEKAVDVTSQYEDGVAPIFAQAQFRKKSPLNDYQMQLAIYSEALQKIGIKVGKRVIYAVAYSVNANKDNTVFTLSGYGVNTYGEGDYYKTNLDLANKIDAAARSRFRTVVDQEAEKAKEEAVSNNPFGFISPEEQRKIIDKLLALTDEQLNKISDEIKAVDQNENLSVQQKSEKKTKLQRRQANVSSLKGNLEKQRFTESTDDIAFANGMVIKLALDVFKQEIELFSKKIKEVDVPKVYQLNNELHRTALATLHSANQNLDDIAAYIELFYTSVEGMSLEENTKTELLKYLSDMQISISKVSDRYLNVSKGVIKAIILDTIGTKNFEKVFGQMRDLLGPRLNWIRSTISKIEAGEQAEENLAYKGKRLLLGILNKKPDKTRLEALKEEADRIESIMKINKLDDKTLDDYLDVVVGPESRWYMGSTMAGANTVITMSDIIGSNADSEMIISAMYQYMRNLTEEGRIDTLNWAQDMDVDKAKNDFIESAGGISQANEMISEEVELVTKFDENGKAVETEKHRQYLDPASAEFYNTRNGFQSILSYYRNTIRDINRQISEAPTETDKDALKAKRKELQAQQEELSLQFTKWEIENTETDVKPEVLMLKRGSGFYNDRISSLYDENEERIRLAGGEEYLTDEDQSLIDDNEAEISRIRQELMQEQPELLDKLNQLMEYYEYTPNYGLWTKKRDEIIAEGNPVLLERWDKNNSDFLPTEEFQDYVNQIYERLAEITTQDPEVESLRAKQRNLRAKAKVRGKFDYRYLTEEDAAEYNRLDEQISKRYSELKEEGDLTPEEIQNIKYYTDLLGSIRTKRLNPEYEKQRDTLRKNVEQAYAEIRELRKKQEDNPEKAREIGPQLEAAERQYANHEAIFADFFNKHNKVKYQVGQNLIVDRKDLNEQPFEYLYEKIPSDPNDMELVPNRKYKIKRLKESAYNPNYSPSFVKNTFGKGMQPMPKGIRFNKQTNEFEISAGAKYVNPKFLELQKNPVAKQFYKTWVVENFLLKQKNASGQPLGFNYPFVKQLGLENVISKGISGVGREYKEKVQELMYSNSKFEEATNESGMAGPEKIVFPENQRMPASLTTTNGIEAILNWNSGYYLNRKMATVNLEMTAVLDFIENKIKTLTPKTIKGTDPRTKEAEELARNLASIRDVIEFNKKKFVHGQVYEREGAPAKIFNRKNARILMKAAAFGRMAFDIPMQVGNLLSGNVQAFLSLSDSRYANFQDYAVAKKLFYTRFLPKMLTDYGKISDVSFETKLYRNMNPLSKDLNRMFDANTVGKLRRLANRVFSFGELSMAIQDKGEFEIGMTTMLMIMNHHKYEVFETDTEGNVLMDNGVPIVKKNADGSKMFVNAIDAHTLYDGKIGLRKDVNVTESEMRTLKGTIMNEIYRNQGNYATYTKTRFGSTLLGTLYEFYRKYLIPLVSTRFSSGGFEGIGSAYSWDAPEAYTGTWTALIKMFRYYGLGQASKTLLYDTLMPGFARNSIKFESEVSQYYRARAAMAGREVMIGIAMLILYNALRSMMMDSDEDDLSIAELMAVRSLVKMSNESRSMIPFPIVGKPADYIDQFGQFTGALREGKTLWELSENSLFYADYAITGSNYAYERGFYQRDTDRYEEGDPKIFKNLADLTGYANIIDVIDPYAAAKRAVKPK